METLVMQPSQEAVEMACKILTSNDTVALPTETVYGLFANATDICACEKIFKAKDRPMDNPLIVHISSYEMLKTVARSVNEDAIKLADAFWPGPLTIILPKTDVMPTQVTAGLDSVGIRMPSNPIILEIISKTNLPLAGPSANRSGRPSPTNAQYVYEDLKGRIPLIIDGGDCNIGVESTVISLVEETPVIFRPGFITQKQIEAVLNKSVSLSKGISEELSADEKVLSPGLKHKHYAPKAQVFIVNATFEKYKELVEKENATALCFDEYAKFIDAPTVTFGSKNSDAQQAAELFTALRKLDEIGAEKVYATMPNLDGIGLAVYNRLLRAAAFRVVNL